MTIWGTGAPRREFLHVDDLAEMIRQVVHPAGTIVHDRSKPDGSPRRLLDVSRLHALGWKHKISLAEGIRTTYDWFLKHQAEARGVTAS